jgi:hypothetical protein
MATNMEKIISEKVHNLPVDEQKKALEFVETLEQRALTRSRPIWEVIEEISNQIPEEEWNKIPSDASINLDHYLYGAPKKSK